MRVPVGFVSYELQLVDGPIMHEGVQRRALCDGEKRTMQIDKSLTIDQRFVEFCHELTHAIKFELDVHDTETMNEESMARLMGMGMARISPKTWCLIHIYLTRGVEPDDVIMLGHQVIPVFKEVPKAV